MIKNYNERLAPFTNEEKRFIKEHYLLFDLKKIAKLLDRSELGIKKYLIRKGFVVKSETTENA